MTREEVYNSCLAGLEKSNCLLIELATGYGKSKVSIDLVNHFSNTIYKNKKTSLLLLVAKTVHKQTWKEEIEKWKGLKVDNIVVECYESLKKHTNESFTYIIADEVHHFQSDIRLEILNTIKFDKFIGLSATIPRKLKSFFIYKYHANIVSCDIIEAIEDDVLPEPQILLMPLELDNTLYSETIELNPKAPGEIIRDSYENKWKYSKKQHVVLKCTQKQKHDYISQQVDSSKKIFDFTRREFHKFTWLQLCNKRLEFLANSKNSIIETILKRLSTERTITFCKTIEQSEVLGNYCIHSKNKDSDSIYNDFNSKKINHITAVNILNENANLVDCKYAVFANLSSSEIVIPQRLGRAMRHKSPVIIVPFFRNTREQEIVIQMFENYNKEYIKTIKTLSQL